jgi:hypothetical protein
MDSNKIGGYCEFVVEMFENEKKDVCNKLLLRYFLSFIVNVVYPFVKSNPHFEGGSMMFNGEVDRNNLRSPCIIGNFSGFDGVILDKTIPVFGFTSSYKLNQSVNNGDERPADITSNYYNTDGIIVGRIDDDIDFVNAYSRPFIAGYLDREGFVTIRIHPDAINNLVELLFVDEMIVNKAVSDLAIGDFVRQYVERSY